MGLTPRFPLAVSEAALLIECAAVGLDVQLESVDRILDLAFVDHLQAEPVQSACGEFIGLGSFGLMGLVLVNRGGDKSAEIKAQLAKYGHGQRMIADPSF